MFFRAGRRWNNSSYPCAIAPCAILACVLLRRSFSQKAVLYQGASVTKRCVQSPSNRKRARRRFNSTNLERRRRIIGDPDPVASLGDAGRQSSATFRPNSRVVIAAMTGWSVRRLVGVQMGLSLVRGFLEYTTQPLQQLVMMLYVSLISMFTAGCKLAIWGAML